MSDDDDDGYGDYDDVDYDYDVFGMFVVILVNYYLTPTSNFPQLAIKMKYMKISYA